jgi:predicted SprT family Zn-dependent metalloprotease
VSSTPRAATPPDSDPDPVDLPDEEDLEARARELFTLWGVVDRLAHIEVLWNGRLRTTAGRAHLRTIQIHLNPRLLARVPDRIDEVLTHEAAHLAVALIHGLDARHHGPEWAALMAAAGHEAKRTHDFPVAGLLRTRSYFLHYCAACGDRRILDSATGAACPCSEPQLTVYRAARNPRGLRALERLNL